MSTTTTDRELAKVESALDSLLSNHDPKAMDNITFRGHRFDAGLAWVHFPDGHGGLGVRPELNKIVEERLRKAGAQPQDPSTFFIALAGPTIVTHGSEEAKQRFLRPMFTGEERWCQLFSEPGAGSDFAGLGTKAVRDGDEWIVNGQKVWTSGALHSTRGMLIARTDPDQPKHRGMSYFIIDIEQPGVEVRPIQQMNGKAHFNEVFFTDARVSDANRIAEVNNGWKVAAATLAFERSGLSAGAGGGIRVSAGERAGLLDRPVAALVAEYRERHEPPDEHGGLSSTLLGLGRELGPVTRDTMTSLVMNERIADMTALRVAAATAAGGSPGPEASTAKLWWTNGLKVSRDLGMEMLGADGMLTGPDTPGDGTVQHFFLTMPSASIAGGSDEIQRNIIGERALGLPKDIQHDPSTPFREIPRS